MDKKSSALLSFHGPYMMGIMEAPKTWSDLKEGRELQPSRDKANQSDDEGTLIQRQERAVRAELEPAEPRACLKTTGPLAL